MESDLDEFKRYIDAFKTEEVGEWLQVEDSQLLSSDNQGVDDSLVIDIYQPQMQSARLVTIAQLYQLNNFCLNRSLLKRRVSASELDIVAI